MVFNRVNSPKMFHIVAVSFIGGRNWSTRKSL